MSAEHDGRCMTSRDDERYVQCVIRAALAGCEIRRGRCADGSAFYVVARWNLSRVLHTIGEVEAWLDRAAPRGAATGSSGEPPRVRGRDA
jgi:hypothetical protein